MSALLRISRVAWQRSSPRTWFFLLVNTCCSLFSNSDLLKVCNLFHCAVKWKSLLTLTPNLTNLSDFILLVVNKLWVVSDVTFGRLLKSIFYIPLLTRFIWKQVSFIHLKEHGFQVSMLRLKPKETFPASESNLMKLLDAWAVHLFSGAQPWELHFPHKKHFNNYSAAGCSCQQTGLKKSLLPRQSEKSLLGQGSILYMFNPAQLPFKLPTDSAWGRDLFGKKKTVNG